MTDEQIVKALRTLDNTLDFIKRQQAEIEHLKTDKEVLYQRARDFANNMSWILGIM